jgi:hypothetical protein
LVLIDQLCCSQGHEAIMRVKQVFAPHGQLSQQKVWRRQATIRNRTLNGTDMHTITGAQLPLVQVALLGLLLLHCPNLLRSQLGGPRHALAGQGMTRS